MSIGLIGKKIGMSRYYDFKGNFYPVTLVNVFNNYVVKLKKYLNYNSFQISFGLKNIFNLNKALFNHYINNFVFFCGILKEFKINFFELNKFNPGDFIPLNIFYINQSVNIFSKSKGKGFSGVIKRFNFKSGPASHGNSKAHNVPGSIGMSQDPGRVFLGKKMPGHLGNRFCFIKNLKILKIDFDYNVFFIKGSIPGSVNSYIFITPNKI